MDAIAAALSCVPAAHAEELVRSVLRTAPRPPLTAICAAIHVYGIIDHVRDDLVHFIASYTWPSMYELGRAIETCASVITDSDERTEIANALEG